MNLAYEFIKQYSKPSFRKYSLHRGIVDKVWNNGNGVLSFIGFIDNKMVVNRYLYRKCYKSMIEKFANLHNLAITFVDYGYPEYYNSSIFKGVSND